MKTCKDKVGRVLWIIILLLGLLSLYKLETVRTFTNIVKNKTREIFGQ